MVLSSLKPGDFFKVLHNQNCFKLQQIRTIGNNIRQIYLDSNHEPWFSVISNENQIDIALITKEEFLNSKNLY